VIRCLFRGHRFVEIERFVVQPKSTHEIVDLFLWSDQRMLAQRGQTTILRECEFCGRTQRVTVPGVSALGRPQDEVERLLRSNPEKT